MDKLKDKLLKLKEELSKAMKNGGIGGPGAVKIGNMFPSIKLSKPGDNNNSATPSTGISQPSKKNPINQAQQIQNKDIKDMKMREAQAALSTQSIVKFDANGQWSLDKGETTDKIQRTSHGARQPAYVRSVFGDKAKTNKVVDSVITPEEQVKAQKDRAAEKKAKAEAEAAKRREQYRKEGVLKGDFSGRSHEKDSADEANMARRKKGNISHTGIKGAPNVKKWGSQGAGAINRETAQLKRKSKKNPVKVFTPEEIAAENERRKKDGQS